MEEKFHSRVTVKPKRKHRGRTESELGCGHENAITHTSILKATHQSNEESVVDQDVFMEDIDQETCQTGHQNVSKLARKKNPKLKKWYPARSMAVTLHAWASR